MYSLADAQLGRILDAIGGRGGNPDVIVVSDHGYSTIGSVIDVRRELANAGFGPSSGFANPGGEPDDDRRGVIVAENGGSALLYVPGNSQQLTRNVLQWLSAQKWVGGIAADVVNPGIPRVAALSDIGLAGRRAPDIAVAMRSNETSRPAPHERLGTVTGGKLGAGSHGGGSPAELHNTLIVSGPSFRSGVDSNLASGNIDIAPTVLELLNVRVPDHLDGRVLWEALKFRGAIGVAASELPWLPASAAASARAPAAEPVIRKVRVGDTEYLCAFG